MKQFTMTNPSAKKKRNIIEIPYEHALSKPS